MLNVARATPRGIVVMQPISNPVPRADNTTAPSIREGLSVLGV